MAPAASVGPEGSRRSFGLLVAGTLLLGLSAVALLPPWEGYDETAHFSYAQELADTRRLPVLGVSRFSTDIEGYARSAPIAYGVTPPMEENGGMTYRAFFRAGTEAIARGRHAVQDPPAGPRRFAPGVEMNWEAQHPPLYYLVLAPLYRLSRSWSWASQLLVLRAVSYLLGWTALLIAAAAARRLLRGGGSSQVAWGIVAAGLWPLMFPAWFADMARLGNDSLCGLIVAGIWYVGVAAAEAGETRRHAIWLGLLLGLGCLTKVFVIPVAAGVLAFWACRSWRRGAARAGAEQLAIALGVALAVGGWWYLRCWRLYGHPVVAATDVLYLPEPGVARSVEVVSLPVFLRNAAAFLASSAWTSTWSLTRPPEWLLTPIVAMAGLIAFHYARVARGHATSPRALPIWMLAPVLAALLFGMLTKAASGVSRGIGGYYLHVLAAPLSFAAGLALEATWGSTAWRRAWYTLLAYTVAFAAAAQWAQLLLYAGIAFKAGASKHYQFDGLPPGLGLHEALGRLGAIAFPGLGVVLGVAGAVLVVAGLVEVRRGAVSRR